MRARVLCLSLLLASVVVGEAVAQRSNRGFATSSTPFIAKGQWIMGGTFSYITDECNAFRFTVVDNINSSSYTFALSPFFAYSLRDNMAVGARLGYNRSLVKLHSAQIDIEDLDMGLDEYYRLKHTSTASAVLRYYIPLDISNRFAIFNEMRLTGGYGEAKLYNGQGEQLTGVYERTFEGALSMAPGLVAFAGDHVAIEVNVGVLGVSMANTSTTKDQTVQGTREKLAVNCQLNLLALELGMSYYF